jgi:hypothetical protein
VPLDNDVNPGPEPAGNSDEDQLLDQILGHLRSQPVREMPALPEVPGRMSEVSRRKSEVESGRSKAKRGSGRWWLAAAAIGLAASLVGVLIWQELSKVRLEREAPEVALQPLPGGDQPRPETDVLPPTPEPPPVTRLAVDLAQPLDQLSAGLDAVDAEIAELRTRAALLDARRKADSLLASRESQAPRSLP